jgi:carboxymethylenebutenolidase
METRTFELSSAVGAMPCYEAVPEPGDSPTRGAVVVLQEAFGVNPHIEDVTRRLATAGYHAVAPHLFHRTGGPTISYDNVSAVMPHIEALDNEGIVTDVETVVSYLQDVGWAADQIGVVGFCMGGRSSFLVAGTLALGAAVGFYGAAIVTGRSDRMGSLLGLVPTMSTPWLGLFGDADPSIPVGDVERLRAELSSLAPVDSAVVRYPGAGHGFHCDARGSYSEEAAIDGWRRTLEWFDSHLAQPTKP